MAGTTVNEGGIVYKTLYKTIKGYDIYIQLEPKNGAVSKNTSFATFIKQITSINIIPKFYQILVLRKIYLQVVGEKDAIKLIHEDHQLLLMISKKKWYQDCLNTVTLLTFKKHLSKH